MLHGCLSIRVQSKVNLSCSLNGADSKVSPVNIEELDMVTEGGVDAVGVSEMTSLSGRRSASELRDVVSETLAASQCPTFD
jgi:hypothetical protein